MITFSLQGCNKWQKGSEGLYSKNTLEIRQTEKELDKIELATEKSVDLLDKSTNDLNDIATNNQNAVDAISNIIGSSPKGINESVSISKQGVADICQQLTIIKNNTILISKTVFLINEAKSIINTIPRIVSTVMADISETIKVDNERTAYVAKLEKDTKNLIEQLNNSKTEAKNNLNKYLVILIVVSILGLGVGVFVAFYSKIKVGVGVSLSSVIVSTVAYLYMSQSEVPLFVGAGFLGLLVVGSLVYVIIKQYGVQKELVQSTQIARQITETKDPSLKNAIDNKLNAIQSDETKKTVSAIKAKL